MTYTQLRLAMEGGGLVPASTTCASTPARLCCIRLSTMCCQEPNPPPQDSASCAGRDDASELQACSGREQSREASGVRVEGVSATCTMMSEGRVSESSPSLVILPRPDLASCSHTRHDEAITASWAAVACGRVVHLSPLGAWHGLDRCCCCQARKAGWSPLATDWLTAGL